MPRGEVKPLGFPKRLLVRDTMKEDYRKLSNNEIEKLIQVKMHELVQLRNELAKRRDESLPSINYDFTQRIND